MKWNGDGDDLIATEGDYTLRVEQMNKGNWWWRCYFKEETIADSYITGPLAKTMMIAVKEAEKAMNEHKQKYEGAHGEARYNS